MKLGFRLLCTHDTRDSCQQVPLDPLPFLLSWQLNINFKLVLVTASKKPQYFAVACSSMFHLLVATEIENFN